jgi:hypothetical protein
MTGTEDRASHHCNNLQENATMKTPRMYYGALAVFCVIALCIGFASAADTTQAAHTGTHGKGNMHPAWDMTNATIQQQIVAHYEQQGVDVTALQTAFQNGDTAAAKSWLEAHRPAQTRSANQGPAKGFDITNATVQQQILARYAKQGVDTSGLAAAFQSGNVTDVKSWMTAHRPAATGFAQGSFGKTPDLTNTTVQQSILARYAKQGVDTTGLAAAFQSGNVTDVKSWMSAHRPAAPGFAQGSFGRTPDFTNATVQQSILARLDKLGVDTSALKQAFQNGDTAAAKSWFAAYSASHPHTAQGRSGRFKASV